MHADPPTDPPTEPPSEPPSEPPTEQTFHYARGRAWIYLALMLAAFAGAVAWGIAFDPAKLPGIYIGLVLVVPLIVWPWIKMLTGARLVTVSPAGITPHEWAHSHIPWSAVRSTYFRRSGAHSYLVLDLEPEGRECIRPVLRTVLKLLRFVGRLSHPGVSVPFTVLAASDRMALIQVLAAVDLAPES